MKLDAKWAELVQLMQKFMPRSRVQIFRTLQETIYSVTEHFRHRSLKIRHKNLSVTFSDSVMY